MPISSFPMKKTIKRRGADASTVLALPESSKALWRSTGKTQSRALECMGERARGSEEVCLRYRNAVTP
ncbi:hypothetical protein D3C80_1698070 [compost metagenome]